MSTLRFRRVLLKLSGEALMGPGEYGIDPGFLAEVAGQLRDVVEMGVELALVVGGGNIFRGLSASAKDMDRVAADQMGMLATVMNALALQGALENVGVPARAMTAVPMPQMAELFTRREAVAHLDAGRVVICGGGTGNPFFTTDTAASLRAVEVGADLLLKGTKVDGVYSDDPVKNPQAERFSHLTYAEVLKRGLRVMDLTAISLCRENRLPIMVFSILHPGTLKAVLAGEPLGTLIEEA